MRILFSIVAIALGFAALSPGAAQTREVPYWASIASPEVRMRVGPSRDFPIEWVYKRDGLPLKVVRVQESWRLVQIATMQAMVLLQQGAAPAVPAVPAEPNDLAVQ